MRTVGKVAEVVVLVDTCTRPRVDEEHDIALGMLAIIGAQASIRVAGLEVLQVGARQTCIVHTARA